MVMQTLLGLFVLYRIMTGQELAPGATKPAAKPSPAPAPQGAVFPSAPPATLPPFPGPGWCEDDPPPVEVSTRASALMTSLWASGAPGARVTELTGGRWIVYAAELDKATGQKAVHVYRSVNCPPLPSQVPAVVVPAAAPAASPAAASPAAKAAPADAPAASPAPMPTASPASASSPPAAAPAPASTTVTIGPAVDVVPIPQPAATPQVFTPSPVQSAAIAMATALTSRASDGTTGGPYRKRDVPVYKAFQAAAGLAADGYPGTGTMTMLDAILSQAGVPAPSVPIYPWKSAGGWNHPNAPTSAEWNS
jgi:hypothetical protein